MTEKPKLLVIAGATATGKTALAVDICGKLNGAIVSADSMQIYREMTVGTAKPTEAELGGVECRLIDFLPPDGAYSVFEYKRDAETAVSELLENGKQPVICGGTGLYIDVLLSDTALSADSRNDEIRLELKRRADSEGGEKLHAELAAVDPISAARIHPNDTKRIIRATEIYLSTGKTQSEWDAESKKAEPKYDVFKVLLNFRSREKLYERIDRRVDEMLDNGLVDEARGLYERYDTDRISAIGYPELFAYFEGKCTLDEAAARIRQYSRNYAKRQLTWFRRGEYDRVYFADEQSRDEISESLTAAFTEWKNADRR